MNKKELVDEFQNAVSKVCATKAYTNFIANDDMALLKIRLLEEEVEELIHSLRYDNIEQVTKELCDVLYICYGIAATYNLPVDDAFLEVHKNNMLKLNNFTIVDGKMIKSPSHPKCNLKHLFER
jgi:predicted HAD superfamily Cof-like phosphohydrolase